MLRIRLRRQGGRKQPTYRIVVTDQRAARDGRFVEIIGLIIRVLSHQLLPSMRSVLIIGWEMEHSLQML